MTWPNFWASACDVEDDRLSDLIAFAEAYSHRSHLHLIGAHDLIGAHGGPRGPCMRLLQIAVGPCKTEEQAIEAMRAELLRQLPTLLAASRRRTAALEHLFATWTPR